MEFEFDTEALISNNGNKITEFGRHLIQKLPVPTTLGLLTIGLLATLMLIVWTVIEALPFILGAGVFYGAFTAITFLPKKEKTSSAASSSASVLPV